MNKPETQWHMDGINTEPSAEGAPHSDFRSFFQMHPPHLVLKWRILVPPTGKFHASAQLFMLMLSHLFASFFDDTRHSHSFFSSVEDENCSLIGVSLTAKRRVINTDLKSFRGNTVLREVSRQCAGSVPLGCIHCFDVGSGMARRCLA